jgi:hypothetical protein
MTAFDEADAVLAFSSSAHAPAQTIPGRTDA